MKSEKIDKTLMKSGISAATVAVIAFGATAASAQELFRDQLNSGTGWGVNSTADFATTLGYDYSADGIAEAPNTRVGDVGTTGFKVEANLIDPAAAENGTIYPVGQNFTGDYKLTFDAWMNFGTGGSTEFLGGGIGYNNTSANVDSGVQAIATGEGGSSSDWRGFKSPAQFFVAGADMAGGTRQGSDAYYADFLPVVSSPASQGTGLDSIAGSPGFQWITWEFEVVGDIVDVSIVKPDSSLLAIMTVDVTDTSDGSNGATRDGNISLFYADFFSSVAGEPVNQFGLFDNVLVERVVPEPTSLALLGVGSLAMLRRRRGA